MGQDYRFVVLDDNDSRLKTILQTTKDELENNPLSRQLMYIYGVHRNEQWPDSTWQEWADRAEKATTEVMANNGCLPRDSYPNYCVFAPRRSLMTTSIIECPNGVDTHGTQSAKQMP